MQVPARDCDIRMPRCGPHLGQRPPARKRVADERVPSVMNNQRPQPGMAVNLARRQKPTPNRVALKR